VQPAYNVESAGLNRVGFNSKRKKPPLVISYEHGAEDSQKGQHRSHTTQEPPVAEFIGKG